LLHSATSSSTLLFLASQISTPNSKASIALMPHIGGTDGRVLDGVPGLTNAPIELPSRAQRENEPGIART
jgi:hypothetical protein